MIEASFGIRIRNREQIVRKIVPHTCNNIQVLTAGMILNTWVAGTAVSGEVTVPEDVIARLISHLGSV
jgi:hypothetical protein